MRRRLISLALASAVLLAAPAASAEPQPARALEPLGTFKHVSWPMEAGAPGRINALAQSQDGWLWIGSVDGLFRFDGIGFERIDFDRPRGERTVVSQVLGARSGDLWVGLARSGGVAVYRHGRLADAGMPHPSREVTGLAEDAEGGVWVARGGRRRDTLARFHGGRWSEVGAEAGLPEEEVWQVLSTRDGALWVVLTDTVMRLPPGARRFVPTGIAVTRRASLAEDAKGRLWLSDAKGTRPLEQGAARRGLIDHLNRGYDHPEAVGGTRIMFDRRGDLWGATWTDGVFHIDQPGERGTERRSAARAFKATGGLTSDQTHAILQDREGDIWIGTELGLDMLKPAAVVVEPAIPPNSPTTYRMAASADGAVYVSDAHTLYAIRPGEAPSPVRRLDGPAGTLCAARGGGVWVMLRDAMLRVRGRAVRAYPAPPPENVFGCAEDAQGRVWSGALEKGLFVFERGAWRAWPGFSSTVGVPGDVALAPGGRAAALLRSTPPPGDRPPVELLHRERFSIGGLEGLLPGRSALFVSGSRGMARMRDGRIDQLAASRYPLLSSVNGLVQTDAGETWTFGDTGVVRMRSADLAAAFDHPGRPLPHQLFDFRDGLNSFVQKAPGAQVAAGADGRIWILARRDVLRIDPPTLETNAVPPPVTVRAVLLGDRRYRDPSDLRLPAGVQTLTVEYTALSLPSPSRVRFRYRLEGVDRDWVDAAGRRQALYSGLRPGRHRFEVAAANNDGVWSRRNATLTFDIPPLLTQTWPFRAACVAAVLLGLWAVYALRLRQVARQLHQRLEERTAERERIARELHDTLLQGVQGLIMRFQSVADQIADDHPAKAVFERALDRADQVMVEGRDRVKDLRRPTSPPLDVVLRELAAEQPFAPGVQVDVQVEGVPRPLRPVVLDEAVRIVGEALFNTARHAGARNVVVRAVFGRRLDVLVSDDGCGIPPLRAVTAASDGHYGLIGMRERANRLHAQLEISSPPGVGTHVLLSLPGALAYAPRGRVAARPPSSAPETAR